MLDLDLAVQRGGLALDVRLRAGGGEVLGILGPNGAGKTTLLQVVAGLVRPAAGRLVVGDDTWDDADAGIHLAPERRDVGYVFQDQLLFPHLSVVGNVAFGLRARGAPAARARHRARERLDRMGLGRLADQAPAALSGGQAQRVALARTLVVEPRVLLLDEPLAALDVQARHTARRELAEHLADFPGPCLFVTHEPVEALALADRLVVLEGGRVTQSGSPAEISHRPRSPWVAELVGVNLFLGTARGGAVELDGGGRLVTATRRVGAVRLVVHPHAVSVHREPPAGSPRNVWEGEVAGLDRQGPRVRVRVEGQPSIVAEVTPQAVVDLELGQGGRVWVSVKATEIQVERR